MARDPASRASPTLSCLTCPSCLAYPLVPHLPSVPRLLLVPGARHSRLALRLALRLARSADVPSQVIILEGQVLDAIHFVKKGKVLLLTAIGTSDEAAVRVVSQYDNFGLSLSSDGAGGTSLSGLHQSGALASQTLDGQIARESARAETYCDLVSLDLADLTALITKDRLWNKLSQANAPSPSCKKGRGGSGGSRPSMSAISFAKRLSTRARSSR